MVQVHFGTSLLRAEWPAAVVCVGTFDGVHLGHREVIRRAVASAREKDLPCVLVTFDRHPAAVLTPDRCPKPIALVQHNLGEFEALGISVCIVLPFDTALSQMPAQTFLDEILREAVKAQSLVVGHDFAMGHAREGTADWLSERIPTEVVAPFEVEGSRVSSSVIRLAISRGDIEYANRLLGAPFAIGGVVVGGQRLGRTLGFPTANLARSFDQVMPADGVYASEALTPYGNYRAALSIGVRPAVGGGDRTIEAFLIDYPGDSLYGRSVELRVLARLREERSYPSLELLVEQIAIDVEQTRALKLPMAVRTP